MPLMKLTCTALERVPLTRATIIGNLLSKFNQDLVFFRSPGDNDVAIRILSKFSFIFGTLFIVITFPSFFLFIFLFEFLLYVV